MAVQVRNPRNTTFSGTFSTTPLAEPARVRTTRGGSQWHRSCKNSTESGPSWPHRTERDERNGEVNAARNEIQRVTGLYRNTEAAKAQLEEAGASVELK